MSDEVLEELSLRLLPKVFYLVISGAGEFFASPRYGRYLEVLDRFPAFREIVTAGVHIDRQAVQLLAQRNTVVSISLDSLSQETLDRCRPGVELSRVIRSIDQLVAARATVKLNVTLMAQNVSQLPVLVEFCRRKGIRNMDVGPLQITEPLVEDEAVDWEDRELHRSVGDAVSMAERYRVNLGLPMGGSFLPHPVGSTRFDDDRRKLRRVLRRAFRKYEDHVLVLEERCTEPWTTVLINVFGDVAPCSVRPPIGHLHAESFDGIWNGDRIRALRRDLSAGRSPGHCASCPKNMAMEGGG